VDLRLKFQRTFDYELVRRIATDPKNWPTISDDFSGPREQWQPRRSLDVWYVLPLLDDLTAIGLFVFYPENTVCWRAHVCISPQYFGPPARQAFRECFAWLWERTDCRRIIGSVPLSNSLAIAFALHCGMEKFGVNPRSTMRGGKLEDQVLLGISKPETAA
jgi:RimJ/RimL family protein N-acetyltransferase